MDSYYGNQEKRKIPGEQFEVGKNPQQWNQQNPVQDIMNITLTPDEQRILQECQVTALIRGFSAGTIGTFGSLLLMQKGIIKRNMFVTALCGGAGLLFGTLSYRSACLQKLMSLPNSTLKERILATQGKQPQLRVDLQPHDGQSQSWFDSVLPTTQFPQETIAPMGSAIDIEPYQSPDYDALPRNPIDHDAAFALNPPLQSVGSSFTTYDDLRRKNRAEYESRMQSPWPSQQPAEMPNQSTDPRSPTFDRAFDSSPPPSSDNYWR